MLEVEAAEDHQAVLVETEAAVLEQIQVMLLLERLTLEAVEAAVETVKQEVREL